MIDFPVAWRVDILQNLLEMQNNKRLLQQGWSPRCERYPSPNERTWAVVKTTAIQAGWFDQSQNKELPVGLPPRPAIEIQAGDLLMTCAGPRSRCGVPALVRATRPKLMMSGKMYRFRPRAELDSRFLEMWLLTRTAQTRIDAMKTGISDSGLNLTQDRFLQLLVPVPDLPEQRRIVEILEDHLSRIDVARHAIEVNARRVDSWAEASQDRVLWQSGWPTAPVRELIREPMRNGRSDRTASGDEEGVRTLTLTAVTSGKFIDENTKMTVTTKSRAESLWLKNGDIFVQRANTPELVGTARRYIGPDRWAIFPDLLIRVRANEEVIDSGLLSAGLESGRAHRWMRSRAKGLAGSMPKIDQETLGATIVPVPPRDRQREVAATLGRIAGAADALDQEVSTAARRVEALRGAVLAAAFSGRLTGRRTDDEVVEEFAEAGA